MTREGTWIDVYPIWNRKVNVVDVDFKPQLRWDLSDFCTIQWGPKAEKGWKSSWIAYAHGITFSDNKVILDASGIPFYEVDGTVKAIEQGLPFAPTEGFIPSVSVGFPVATSDGKVIFQRRAPDVHVPNTLIHEPCGYMASMNFAPRAECDDLKYANDPRLFDLKGQLDFRAGELAKTFGLDASQVTYDPKQDFLATGWLSKELYFSTTGRIDATQAQLKMPEKGEFFFVPFEHLKDLIHNQARLSKVSPEGYRPTDSREVPLIDESLSGLIWGYEKLTGERLDVQETVERLNHGGMEIKVMNTRGKGFYNFDKGFYDSLNDL